VRGSKDRSFGIGKRFLLWFCSLIKSHWIASAVLLTASGWWFSLVVTFYGEQFELISIDIVSGAKSLTASGKFWTIFIFALIVVVTLANKYNQTFSEENRKLMVAASQIKTLEQMLWYFGESCEEKTHRALKSLEKINKKELAPFYIYSYPGYQLEKLLDNLRKMSSMVLSVKGGYAVDTDEIYASLAFRMPQEPECKWQWADIRRRRGLDLSTIISSPRSTFNHLLNSSRPSVFHNSKEQAKAEGKYLADGDDKYQDEKLLGSIACYKLDIKHYNETYIEAILSLTTYNKPFAPTQDEKTAEANLEDFVVNEFEKRLSVELCNYYFYALYNQSQ